MLARLVRFLLQQVALWETSQGEENISFWEPLNYTDLDQLLFLKKLSHVHLRLLFGPILHLS